jgi:hypothetical protein
VMLGTRSDAKISHHFTLRLFEPDFLLTQLKESCLNPRAKMRSRTTYEDMVSVHGFSYPDWSDRNVQPSRLSLDARYAPAQSWKKVVEGRGFD